jgi:PhnB protein
MPVRPIPEGFHTVTPYLVVPGVARLIEFLKQAFDAKEIHRSAMPDGTVAHAQVRIGDSMVMMGEASERWPAMPAAIYLYVPDADAAYKSALRAGATSLMEPADQFYGDRHGGVKDASGNTWWMATHIEDVAPDELARRAEAAMKQHAGCSA